MATGPQHYQRAEELLAKITNDNGSVKDMDGQVASYIEAAQVHATLAHAAATAMSLINPDLTGAAEEEAWAKVASEKGGSR